jgi:hypothetical protein
MPPLETALRVLSAITAHNDPDRCDVETLHHFAPTLNDVAPDELACEVIQMAIRHKAAMASAEAQRIPV